MLCFHGHLSPMKSLQGFVQMQFKKKKLFFKLTMFLLFILVAVVTSLTFWLENQ